MKTITAQYRDLLPVEVQENGESLVYLSKMQIACGYWKSNKDMEPFFDAKILVRKTVAEKLQQANAYIQKKTNNRFELYVTYGYRLLDIQKRSFQKTVRDIISQTYISDPIELYERTHKIIAVPTVAGHPTGGAVDMLLRDRQTKQWVSFGSTIYDYSCTTYPTFSDKVNNKAMQNRLLLRTAMCTYGFAPFNGEWWHFSYGDREWAYYYKKPFALYAQLSVRQAKNLLVRRNKT
ncbi:MAG: M15 family metallopeptidase [Microgenomates group bacterium]